MASYTEFADKMLVALYQEAERLPTHLLISFEAMASRYGLPWQDAWLGDLAQEWQDRDWARVHRPLSGTPAATITADGRREVERRYGDKHGVGEILTPVDQPEPNYLVTEGGDYLTFEGERLTFAVPPEASTTVDLATIDSAGWTGIAQRLEASPAVVDQIRSKVFEIDQLVEKSHLTNEERAKAKAISAALVSLVESPEPEWKVIVELLSSKPMSAFMNAAKIVGWILAAILLVNAQH